jgi:serine/threonine protein kinase
MENQALLDKYQVELDAARMPVELRRHATGVTCKGHEIGSGREVAVEFVRTRSLDSETRKEVEAHAIATQQINHVNIPKLYDFAFDGKDLIYVTEYFDGITAESWVTTNGPMPVRAVLHVALQVVSALGAATFQLVMHRAIHPGNLLIVSGQTTDGDAPLIKVLHFGRPDPKLLTSGKRGTGIDKSAPFASPEQLESGTVDFRSEIYSLGCTLWSLLTGVSPFNAPGKPLAGAQMAVAMKRFRGVPRKIRRLITQMAATDPDNRPLDPVVMTQQLQDCLASVERREALARKIGIPATWQRGRVAKPVGPLSLRPLAMAAVLFTAALTALLITNGATVSLLWKRLSDRGLIGVPIGVSPTSVASSKTNESAPASSNDAATAANEAALLKNLSATKSSASSTPSASSADTSAVTTTPPPVVASVHQDKSGASSEASPTESFPQSSTVPPPDTVATNQNSVTKVEAQSPPAAPNEQNGDGVDSHATETAASSPSAIPRSNTESAATKPMEPATVSRPTVAANNVPRAELIEGPPAKSSSLPPKSVADNANQSVVPRAELVEPPPPTEGPDDETSNTSANAHGSTSSLEEMKNVPRAELIEPPPAKKASQKRPRTSYGPTKSELVAIRNASRRANHARVWAEGDGAMVQTPDGMVHARLVGTTRDGQWMLSLPSRKIMIVPPPPDFIQR